MIWNILFLQDIFQIQVAEALRQILLLPNQNLGWKESCIALWLLPTFKCYFCKEFMWVTVHNLCISSSAECSSEAKK